MVEANQIPETRPEFIEGVRLRVVPAPLWRRLIAFAIDLGIVSAATYAAFILLLIFGGAAAVPLMTALKNNEALQTSAVLAAILVVLVVVLVMMCGTHIFFIYYEFKKGATPGKRLMGLRVVSTSGGPITKGQAIYRDFVRWYIDTLFIFPALISILVTEKKQRVGDLLADTVVVFSVKSEEEQKFLYVKRDDYVVLFEHLKPKPVPAEMRNAFLSTVSQLLLLNPNAQFAGQQDWLARIRQHLERTEELQLNDHTVLMFFAEYCFQEDLKLKQKREVTNG